jgi:hypothetical protein
MWIRYEIWKARYRARVLSRHSNLEILASLNSVPLGNFRKGKEVK